MAEPEGVHLVGSMPVASAEETFRTVSAALGDRLWRLPDGEPGARARYVGYQRPIFEAHPLLEPGAADPAGWPNAIMRPKPGARAEDLTFGKLGYAAAAVESFGQFARLQQEGAIPAHARFQVCLPVPMDAVCGAVLVDAQLTVAPGYEAAMRRELEQVLAAIPHERLSVQWDVCHVVLMWEGWLRADPRLDDLRPRLLAHLVAMGSAVPGDVELGYHLCYADMAHRHFREPTDTGVLVEIANGLTRQVPRPIQWLHLPVPIERDDEAYFQPLGQLGLRPETHLFLGLIHYRDAVAGARRRIAAAQRFVDRFGVATECGMGRRPPERGGTIDGFRELLALHTAVARPVV
jgi:hypothetical protein